MQSSIRSVALTAGISIVIMALAAGFSVGYVQSQLLVPGDAMATLENLEAQPSLFRAGIGGWVLIFLCDLVAAWALFRFFRKTNDRLSWGMAASRVLYGLILGWAIYQFSLILELLRPGDVLAASTRAQVILEHWTTFLDSWSYGLIIFGLHLLLLGVLALQMKLVPRIWGYLLLLAGLSYSFIHAAGSFDWLSPDLLSTIEMILAVPMTVAELGFAVWLIFKSLTAWRPV